MKKGKVLAALLIPAALAVTAWAEPDINLKVISQNSEMRNGKLYRYYFSDSAGNLLGKDFFEQYYLECEVLHGEDNFDEFNIKTDDNGIQYLYVEPTLDEDYIGRHYIQFKLKCYARERFRFETQEVIDFKLWNDLYDENYIEVEQDNAFQIFNPAPSNTNQQVTYELTGAGEFKVVLGKNDHRQNMAWNQDTTYEIAGIEKAYDISILPINFVGKPEFENVGELSIQTTWENVYLYENGKLYRVNSEYHNGTVTIRTNRLGCFLFCNAPIGS